jgi:hypothetical protein
MRALFALRCNLLWRIWGRLIHLGQFLRSLCVRLWLESIPYAGKSPAVNDNRSFFSMKRPGQTRICHSMSLSLDTVKKPGLKLASLRRLGSGSPGKSWQDIEVRSCYVLSHDLVSSEWWRSIGLIVASRRPFLDNPAIISLPNGLCIILDSINSSSKLASVTSETRHIPATSASAMDCNEQTILDRFSCL